MSLWAAGICKDAAFNWREQAKLHPSVLPGIKEAVGGWWSFLWAF
jgi:hypothetical protein